MHYIGQHKVSRAFALPTVLIASTVLLIVLAVSVTATTAVRAALKGQYYTQLAQVAGEAGVTYAQACLAANANIPQWSDANPLTPITNCSGVVQSGISCPNDARCWVTQNGNIRSSFSVGLPTLDVDGRAVTIANTGFVQILRTSTNTVWRTYKQPNVQPVAVPDLCSGSATSSLGWSNAVKATTQDAFAPNAAAQSITNSVNGTSPGTIFFRKDFYAPSDDVYKVSILAPPTLIDTAVIYVDGQYVMTSKGSVETDSVTLSKGCHNVMIHLTNTRIPATANRTRVTASIKADAQQTAVVATDPSWRWDVGQVEHYSDVNYFSEGWSAVRELGPAINNGAWSSTTGDYFARVISTLDSYSSGNYPSSSWTYFRDSRDITVSTATQVKVSVVCDDYGVVYLDGAPVVSSTANPICSGIVTRVLTLTPGKHKFGLALGNNTGPAGIALAVTRVSDGVALTYTDETWQAANYWAGGLIDLYSYDKTFMPSPSPVVKPQLATVLVVGGGGGGGGNGGGGGGAGAVLLYEDMALTPGSYTVTIGAGGAGSASSSVTGSNGAITKYDVYTADGGGGGASRDGGGGGKTGGSGGGGGGGPSPQLSPGTAYLSNRLNYGLTLPTAGMRQGNPGATGFDSSCTSAGGGGGSYGSNGNPAASNLGGNGGSGYITYITGSFRILAGGGGGGATCSPGVAGRANGGAGSGGIANTTGGSGSTNTGGGGGGGGLSANGGSGGSGVVIITYPTGSITATGGSKTSSNGNTNHVFNSSGTFTVQSI